MDEIFAETSQETVREVTQSQTSIIIDSSQEELPAEEDQHVSLTADTDADFTHSQADNCPLLSVDAFHLHSDGLLPLNVRLNEDTSSDEHWNGVTQFPENTLRMLALEDGSNRPRLSDDSSNGLHCLFESSNELVNFDDCSNELPSADDASNGFKSLDEDSNELVNFDDCSNELPSADDASNGFKSLDEDSNELVNFDDCSNELPSPDDASNGLKSLYEDSNEIIHFDDCSNELQSVEDASNGLRSLNVELFHETNALLSMDDASNGLLRLYDGSDISCIQGGLHGSCSFNDASCGLSTRDDSYRSRSLGDSLNGFLSVCPGSIRSSGLRDTDHNSDEYSALANRTRLTGPSADITFQEKNTEVDNADIISPESVHDALIEPHRVKEATHLPLAMDGSCSETAPAHELSSDYEPSESARIQDGGAVSRCSDQSVQHRKADSDAANLCCVDDDSVETCYIDDDIFEPCTYGQFPEQNDAGGPFAADEDDDDSCSEEESDLRCAQGDEVQPLCSNSASDESCPIAKHEEAVPQVNGVKGVSADSPKVGSTDDVYRIVEGDSQPVTHPLSWHSHTDQPRTKGRISKFLARLGIRKQQGRQKVTSTQSLDESTVKGEAIDQGVCLPARADEDVTAGADDDVTVFQSSDIHNSATQLDKAVIVSLTHSYSHGLSRHRHKNKLREDRQALLDADPPPDSDRDPALSNCPNSSSEIAILTAGEEAGTGKSPAESHLSSRGSHRSRGKSRHFQDNEQPKNRHKQSRVRRFFRRLM